METLLIADPHQIVRLGIRAIIENRPEQFNIIEAATCSEVLQVLSMQPVHYIIIEMFLADGNIFSTVNHFLQYVSSTSVLVHSMDEKLYARRLMQNGIRGFVSKGASVQDLENAIQCLLKGEIYLSSAMKEDLFKPGKPGLHTNPIDTLSDRELEVIEYIATGMGTNEIAAKMMLEAATISTYRRRAFYKLGVKNIVQLKDKLFMYKIRG